MVNSPLLEAKYQTQKQLDAEAEHDIRKYIFNLRHIVSEVEREYGLRFKHGSPPRTQ